MKPKSAKFHMGAGISTILLLFVMLCLTVFGILSYMTAAADGRLSAKTNQATESYYAANATASEKLAKLDTLLHTAERCADSQPAQIGSLLPDADSSTVAAVQAALKSADRNTCCQAVLSVLLQGQKDWAADNAAKPSLLTCAVPIDQNRTLSVKAAVEPFGSPRYRIQAYQVLVSDDTQDYDPNLNVWQG